MKKYILSVVILVGFIITSCGKEKSFQTEPVKEMKPIDDLPPIIHNAPKSIEVYQFEKIDVQQILDEANVYVTDNVDKNLSYTIDSEKLNIEEIGTYDIILTANDSSNNTTHSEIPVVVQFDPSIPEDFIEYRKFIGRDIHDLEINNDMLEDNNEFVTYGKSLFFEHEGGISIQYNLTTKKIWSIFFDIQDSFTNQERENIINCISDIFGENVENNNINDVFSGNGNYEFILPHSLEKDSMCRIEWNFENALSHQEKNSNDANIVIKKSEPKIGMTQDEVRQSTWGSPSDINKTTTKYAISEQWVYSNNRYIYFENGIVTVIQE